MTNENGLPKRIWVCTHLGECGHYYPEAVEAEGEWGGVAVPYVPETISDAKDARIAELEGGQILNRNAINRKQARITELEAKLHIYEGRNGQPVSSTGMVDEMADALKQKDKRIAELEAKLAKAIGTLTSIEKWVGEFPSTNKFWPHGKPMSYVAAYGSNGERDFMREKARKTIAELGGQPNDQ